MKLIIENIGNLLIWLQTIFELASNENVKTAQPIVAVEQDALFKSISTWHRHALLRRTFGTLMSYDSFIL